MRKTAAVVLISGFLMACALAVPSANAQTQTAAPLLASETSMPKYTVEFRLLAPDGKVTAHLFAELEIGQTLKVSNFQRTRHTRNKNEETIVCRFEGKGTIKTTRNGTDVVLLQTDRDDAVVEYTISLKK